MTVASTRIASLHDATSALVLRDIEDGAETSTTTETPVELPRISNAYWADDQQPGGEAVVQFSISAVDTSNGDETYILAIQVDDTHDHSNRPVTVWSATISQPSNFKVGIDLDAIRTVVPDAPRRWLAVKATLGGTSPLINYGATLVKSI